MPVYNRIVVWAGMFRAWNSAFFRTLFRSLNVSHFTPDRGWPGTMITISGSGFSANRDENAVAIDGVPAIIIESASDQLLVLAGEATTGGPLTVTVNSKTIDAGIFEVLPFPLLEDPTQAGAPRFFHGPMAGTPQTNVANQPVLVLLTFPEDHDPGGVAASTAARNDLIDRCDQAAQYWDEVSYGSTTWNMSFSNWLALPAGRPRRFYFWEQGDIDDARRALFFQTSRSLVFSAGQIYHGVGSNGFIPVGHPNPTTYNHLPGLGTAGSRATALLRNGNRLYAGTAAGRVYVFDVTNPSAPVDLGGSLTGGPNDHIMGLDVSGNHLLVAAREGGIRWMNTANPAGLVLDASIHTGADWATAVKVAGNRGYVGTGTRLRIYDLAGPAPVEIANLAVGMWVTGVDVAGNTCVVATDGDGLHVFEITAGGALFRAAFRNVLRLRAVQLVGNLAFLAANTAGLVIVDVSNLAAPAQKGQLATTKPCFNVAVSGSEAILALGALVLLSVSVSNPAAPVKNHGEMATSWEPDLAGLQTALQVADDVQNFVKDSNDLFIDALRAWLTATGGSLDPFQGIIVFVNGPFLRGQSWISNGFSKAGVSITFNHAKGVLYLAQGAGVARIAHEIGHWLGMWDIYEEWFADGTVLQGTAAPWCLSGDGDRALFTAHQIHDIMRFYEVSGMNANVVERVWSPTSSLDERFDVVAHDADEDTEPSRVHILKLKAAEGLYYYVEVRQRPIGRIFDQTIPIPAGQPGVTVVTRVTQGTSISNTFERPIMLFGVLQPGEQVVDAARSLIIRVEQQIQERPLIHRVHVQWNQPILGDPNGTFDMTITPWSTDTWETVDVWVDSPRNNPGGAIEYEFHEGADRSRPRLNGDRPWVRRNNQIYARIRNSAPQAVSDVFVTCYVNSPPGIGDNGQWATLSTQRIATLPGHGETVISFDWRPELDKHTCLKIAILPQIGEIETKNNMGQENVATFDSAAASSAQPVILEAEVRSPFVIWRKVDLVVRALPAGWHAVVDQSWVWVEGHGTRPIRAVIWTEHIPALGEDQEYPGQAFARVEGWTTFDHRYLPIGGVLAAVKAVQKVRVEFWYEYGGGTLYLGGCLTPPLSGVPITAEVTDEHGNSWLLYAVTNSQGCFDIFSDAEGILFKEGVYVIQVFVTAGGKAAQTESEPRKAVLK